MGEQPIFTCKAHVFHIDPKTRKSWLPISKSAVSVSFFYDSPRNLYRIISVEKNRAVINSTMTPNMTFAKTSQKFGQWSDVHANTVYGLGFGTEVELNKFIDKFQEVREACRDNTDLRSDVQIQEQCAVDADDNSAVEPVGSVRRWLSSHNGTSLSSQGDSADRVNTASHNRQHDDDTDDCYTAPPDLSHPANSVGRTRDLQAEVERLRAENERLRISSRINSTLPQPDGECSIESCRQLRQRLAELEISGKSSNGNADSLSDDSHSKSSSDSALRLENAGLKTTVAKLESQLEMALAAQASQRRVVDAIASQMGDHIVAIERLHTELAMEALDGHAAGVNNVARSKTDSVSDAAPAR